MALRPSERRAATLVAFLSVLFVGLVILSQRVSHGGVHAAIPDTSSPVGWAAVLGSIVTFGSYGIPIKVICSRPDALMDACAALTSGPTRRTAISKMQRLTRSCSSSL